MDDASGAKSRVQRRFRGAMRVGAAAVCAVATAGCGIDSFLDPSVVGRWEYTPTTVPVLERIDLIEDDTGEFVETSEIMPQDLIPRAVEYEVGPGDALTVEIFDFYIPNEPTQLQRIVDTRGRIDIPQIGDLNVLGLTANEIESRIRVLLAERGIIDDALVNLQVSSRRQATYAILGAVPGVGRYAIPEPDFRLLDAMTEAGGVPEAVKNIFVIRQVALTEAVERGVGAEAATPTDEAGGEDDADDAQQDQTDLDTLIEELTAPQEEPPSLGMAASAGADAQPDRRPQVDLPDNDEPSSPRPRGQAATPSEGAWVFLNGRWVKVARGEGSDGDDLLEGADPLAGGESLEDLVTQRVIEVPLKPVLQGSAEHNIVIRPGDVIRVPQRQAGFVYMGGPGIARPGVYGLPAAGRLTLTKAVIAAGGFSPIATPWRVDLTRMVGENRQATVRLNLRAIFAGTEPDVFLKPDDVVNIGTDWWAQPLAVIRNGFRASYGFGFLLDRNFGNDVFGAPPSSFNP